MRWFLSLGFALVLAGVPDRAILATPSSSPFGVREAIITYLEERAPLPPRSIEVPPLASFFVPGISAADVDIEVSSHPKAPRLGRVPVTVTLISSGRILRRGVVNAQVHADVEVVVAAAPVQRGQRIGAEDLKLENRDASGLGNDWLDDPTELIGQRARRRVAPGAMWEKSWAETPPTVKRGELVRLLLVHGRLRIEGKGIVRKDARAGEWIRVVNADSKRELLGRVASDGAVHVEF